MPIRKLDSSLQPMKSREGILRSEMTKRCSGGLLSQLCRALFQQVMFFFLQVRWDLKLSPIKYLFSLEFTTDNTH